MALELTFLGSGNAFAAGGRYWSSFLANARYLFDAPPTLLPHLKRLGMPLTGIEVIFISHFHGDHFMGLPFLFLEYVYLTERRDDLFIVGLPGAAHEPRARQAGVLRVPRARGRKDGSVHGRHHALR